MDHTKNIILQGGIILVTLVFFSSLGRIFYLHYLEREHHINQFRNFMEWVEPGSDWETTEKMLLEKQYKIQAIQNHAQEGKILYYRCQWPARQSRGKSLEYPDYEVRMHYDTHGIIGVSPEKKVISRKGNISR